MAYKIRESEKETISPNEGMRIRGVDAAGNSVNYDYDDIAHTNKFRGHVDPTDAVPADIKNGEWVRCKQDGTYTNFSGLTASIGNRLEYFSETSTWLKVNESGSGDILLSSNMDANGHKIEELGDAEAATDALNVRSANNQFLEPQKNKYNPDNAIDDSLISTSNGVFASAAGYANTGYIPCLPSTEYACWKTGESFLTFHFYDADKVWIGHNGSIPVQLYSITGGKRFTTPSNCYYVGTWIVKNAETFETFKNSIQFELGTVPTAFEPYNEKLKQDLASLPSGQYTNDEVDSEITTGVLSANNYTDSEIVTAKNQVNEYSDTQIQVCKDSIIDTTKNKYNPALAEDNKLYNHADGAEAAYTGWSITGKIPVLPNTQYAFWKSGNSFSFMHFYDSNEDWIESSETHGSIASITGGKTFTTTADCFFVASWSTRASQSFDEFRFSIQLELGSSPTTFEPYSVKLKEDLASLPVGHYTNDEVDSEIAAGVSAANDYTDSELTNLDLSFPLTIIKSSGTAYIRSKFNETYDLVQSFTGFTDSNFKNNNVNFGLVYLIGVGEPDSVSAYTSGILIASPLDDACPNSYNGTYIGANHGCADAKLVTATAHGKTVEDIGSEWTDGAAVKWYLIRVVDADKLWMLSEDLSATDIWNFNTTLTGNLTHSSGATHTGAITVAANAYQQIYPATKNVSKKILINGNTELVADGTYQANYIDIVDNYDIVNPSSMLDNLIAAVGTTYTDSSLHSALQNGVQSVFNQICYRIQKNGGVVILYGWRTYQEIDLGKMGFIQAYILSTTTYPKLKLYLPKALPISDGSKSWDFRNIESWDSAPAATLFLSSDYWEEPTSPPERAIEYLCDTGGTKKIGFAVGYDLVKGIGAERSSLINNAFYIPSSRKLYPYGIDNKLGNVVANTWYSAIMHRQYFDAETLDKGNATNLYHYELGSEIILVLDYHTTANFDELKLPAEYVGKTVSVVEKSTNVTIHTDEVLQSGITVSVGAGAYAYAVLKLS